MQETRVQSLGREDPLEKGMATHSSILAWRIHGPLEKPGAPQFTGSQRVGHDSVTNTHTHTHTEAVWSRTGKVSLDLELRSPRAVGVEGQNSDFGVLGLTARPETLDTLSEPLGVPSRGRGFVLGVKAARGRSHASRVPSALPSIGTQRHRQVGFPRGQPRRWSRRPGDYPGPPPRRPLT